MLSSLDIARETIDGVSARKAKVGSVVGMVVEREIALGGVPDGVL